MQNYLELARQGKNEWWRVVLAVLLMLFMWQVLGAMPSAILLVWMALRGQLRPGSTGGGLPGMDTLAGFVALMLASVFFLGGIYLAMRFIHRRPLRTLVTPARSVAWGRLFQGFGVWFGLAALMSLVEALALSGAICLEPGPGTVSPVRFSGPDLHPHPDFCGGAVLPRLHIAGCWPALAEYLGSQQHLGPVVRSAAFIEPGSHGQLSPVGVLLFCFRLFPGIYHPAGWKVGTGLGCACRQ